MIERKYNIMVPIIILSFISIIIWLIYLGKTSSPLPHTALEILIGNSEDEQLSIKNVTLADIYPADYQEKLEHNFYRFTILDKNQNVLFTGKIANKRVVFVDVAPGYQSIPPFEKPIEEFLLFLPYFPSSSKVNFYDDKNSVKLEVNLSDYHLNPSSLKRENLCGNGICDGGENVLSCKKDCSRQLEFLWKKIDKSYLP